MYIWGVECDHTRPNNSTVQYLSTHTVGMVSMLTGVVVTFRRRGAGALQRREEQVETCMVVSNGGINCAPGVVVRVCAYSILGGSAFCVG